MDIFYQKKTERIFGKKLLNLTEGEYVDEEIVRDNPLITSLQEAHLERLKSKPDGERVLILECVNSC